jgi:lipopolysaccharide export system ATP-binding protein
LPAGEADRGERLAFQNVVKTYGKRTVVDGVTLSVEAGSVVALAGVNGSGKTTLFRVAAGFVRPDAGWVEMTGAGGPGVMARSFVASQRAGAGLCYVSQDRLMFRGLSTLDNLRIAKAASSGATHVDAQTIFACLAELRLMRLLDVAPSRMEAAESVLLHLAKAYFCGARFLIVDEPFAGLDRPAIDHCIAIIDRMRDRGTGILLTDHHGKPMLQIADTVHIMKEGALVYSGSVEETRSSARANRLYFNRRA